MHRSRTAVRSVLAMAATAVLAACGGPGIEPLPVGAPPDGPDALPACRTPDRPTDAPAVVEGETPLPADAFLLRTEQLQGLTVASGWATGDPAGLREFYEEQTPEGWTLMTAEDEMVEAEILLRRSSTRFFVQAVATCRDGMDLYVRVTEVGTP